MPVLGDIERVCGNIILRDFQESADCAAFLRCCFKSAQCGATDSLTLVIRGNGEGQKLYLINNDAAHGHAGFEITDNKDPFGRDEGVDFGAGPRSGNDKGRPVQSGHSVECLC